MTWYWWFLVGPAIFVGGSLAVVFVIVWTQLVVGFALDILDRIMR